MRDLIYRLQAWIAQGAFALLRLIPLQPLSACFAAALGFIGPRTGVQRRIDSNLDAILGEELTTDERRAVGREVWRHWGRMIAELPHTNRIADPQNGYIRLENREAYDIAQAEGRGVILISAHFGNWEATMAYVGNMIEGLTGFYRKQNNPHIDAWLKRRREATGAKLIAKGDRQGLKDTIEALKNGGVAAMLVDQRLDGGADVPFFGKNAPTIPLPYSLAKATGAAVMTGEVRRHTGDEPFGFTAKLGPEIKLPDTGDKRADQLAFLTEMNRQIETMIRQDLAQWLWAHRRWSKQVEGASRHERAKRVIED